LIVYSAPFFLEEQKRKNVQKKKNTKKERKEKKIEKM